MNSVNEAIKYSVPMIGIPIGNDQPRVAETICDRHRMGLRFDFRTFSTEDISIAAQEIIDNGEYKRNILKWSEIIQSTNGAVQGANLILSLIK